MAEAVEILRRQYLQLLDPKELAIPTHDILRRPHVQDQIYKSMFKLEDMLFPIPSRYQLRVLKRLLESIENAIEDPEEDEISDDLTNYFANLISDSRIVADATVQQKNYVTYTAPMLDDNIQRITLLESRSLIASAGTTGLRTWEAALHLGHFLFSMAGSRLIEGKRIIELGAGTGFISILCALHLGAQRVLATDGSGEVVDHLMSNLFLNDLEGSTKIEATVLKWGHALIDGIFGTSDSSEPYNLILGADVTYDLSSLPPLVATLGELFEKFPGIKAIISATIRNEQTIKAFEEACSRRKFTMNFGDQDLPKGHNQLGFYYSRAVPVRIMVITGPPLA